MWLHPLWMTLWILPAMTPQWLQRMPRVVVELATRSAGAISGGQLRLWWMPGTLVRILLKWLLVFRVPSRPQRPASTLLGTRHPWIVGPTRSGTASPNLLLSLPWMPPKRLMTGYRWLMLTLALQTSRRRDTITDLAVGRSATLLNGDKVALTTLILVLTVPTQATLLRLYA